MNQARWKHSSCQLAAYLYVFCGYNNDGYINSIEKLEITEDPNLQINKQWELISESNFVHLPKLVMHFTIALNNEEILIFGGLNYEENKVHIFDTKTDKCKSIAVSGKFIFYNVYRGGLSSTQCGHNKVVALVKGYLDGCWKSCLVKYVKRTSSITILH